MRILNADIVVIGHLTIDEIILEGSGRIVPGGSVLYTSVASIKMDSFATVVSKIGFDFPDEFALWISKLGIDFTKVHRANSPTTRFILKYGREGRIMKLLDICEPIFPEDLPEISSKAVHLGPVVGEISIEVIKQAREMADIVSLDLQGLVRSVNQEGFVQIDKPISPDILSLVDVLKSSEEEIKVALQTEDVFKAMKKAHELGPEIIIVTAGEKGSFILHRGSIYGVPACRPKKIVDPTGAGDVFIGAFMAEYIKGGDPCWCASIGSSASSFILEGIGPSCFGSKNEVEERAIEAYELIRKVGRTV